MKLVFMFPLFLFLFSNCSSDKKHELKDSVAESQKSIDSISPEKKGIVHSDIYPKELIEFIKPDYELEDTASGDLNLDGTTDWIMVLKKKNEENYLNPPVRWLLLVCSDSLGKFYLAEKSDKAIDVLGSGGMRGPNSYSGLTISNGSFEIKYLAGLMSRSEEVTVRFTYSSAKRNWFCTEQRTFWYNANYAGTDSIGYYSGNEIKTVSDFGILSFEKFSIRNLGL